MEVKSLKKNVGNASPFVNRIFLLFLHNLRLPSFAGFPLVQLPQKFKVQTEMATYLVMVSISSTSAEVQRRKRTAPW